MKLLLENWRKYLKEAKLRVFDFDDTLIRYNSEWEYEGNNDNIIDFLRRFHGAGYKVFIVTTRFEEFETSPDRINIAHFVEEYNLPIAGIIFTENQDKVYTLQDLGSLLHFDDDEFEHAAIEQKAPHIKTVKIDYQTGNIVDGLQYIKEMGI